MWSSNEKNTSSLPTSSSSPQLPSTSTSTSTATPSSDNKKKENKEDCHCSSATAADGAAAAQCGHSHSGGGGGDSERKQQQQQQQQMNLLDNNSKKAISTFGGNLTDASGTQATAPAPPNLKKDKELSLGAHVTESSDSGFISGPQSNTLYDQEEEEEGAVGGVSGVSGGASSSSSSSLGHSKPSPSKTQKHVVDSGCIDEEEDEDVGESDQKAEVTRTKHEVHQPQKQHSVPVGLNTLLSKTPAASGAPTAGSTDAMIFKHNVDSGMSEWFSHLSLQNETVARSHQQQVASGLINNLNAATGRSNRQQQQQQQQQQKSLPQQQQQQQHEQAAGKSAGTATQQLAPWEQYYQQNDDGDTYLHLACLAGSENVVAALIRLAPHPCLLDIQNDDGQTALHLAALTSQPKVLRMLLVAGAEPTIRDCHGDTALHNACNFGYEQCVHALTLPFSGSEITTAHLHYGHRSSDKTLSSLSYAHLPSDLEIRNYNGERCVHLATQGGYLNVLKMLVHYGADINAREGKSGRTPLHIAIETCNEDLVKYLLDDCQTQLNLETATYAGLTAYQIACILQRSQIQSILEKRGAEPLTPPDSDYDSSDIETELDDSKNYDRFGDPGYFASYNGGNPMTVA